MRRTRIRRAGKRSKKVRRTRRRRMSRGCGCRCSRCKCRSQRRSKRCGCCTRCKCGKRGGRRSRRKVMRGGGYYQYMSDTPYAAGVQTPATGGYLKGSDTALANPVTFDRTMNCGDNYNHYTGSNSSSV
jgi:hypothetical protein